MKALHFPHFNSHAHVERDNITVATRNDVEISTHTLTWSVTMPSVIANIALYFNSHAHVERD